MLDMTDDARTRLSRLVERAIDDRSYDEAVDWLLDALQDDRPAYDLMMQPYAARAARELVTSAVHMKRSRIWNNAGNGVSRGDTFGPQETANPAAHPGTNRNTVAALSAGVVRSGLMDFRLHDGTPLSDAGKEKVLQAAALWGKQASDMAWKARWMNRVAEKVPEGKTVRDALDESALAAMKEETQNV